MKIINTKNVLVKENISFPYHSVTPLFRQAPSLPSKTPLLGNSPVYIGFFYEPRPPPPKHRIFQ